MQKKAVWGSLVLALLLAFAPSAQAQVTPTSYSLKFFNVGGTTPVQTVPLLSSQYQCGVLGTAPLPTGRWIATWTDPINAANRCQFVDTGSGPFSSRPANSAWDIALGGCIVNSAAVVECGPDSPMVRFDNKVLPSAPGGFQIRPGASATISGVIEQIGPDWTTPTQTEWRIVALGTPEGPINMHVGSVVIPGYGAVEVGEPYELTVFRRPPPPPQ